MIPFFLPVLRMHEMLGLKAMYSMSSHFVDRDFD